MTQGVDSKVDKLVKDVEVISDWRTRLLGSLSTLTMGGGLVGGLAALAVAYFKFFGGG